MKDIKLNKKTILILQIIAVVFLASLFIFFVLRALGPMRLDGAGNQIRIFDNVAFTIFGRDIYFYALCIMTGITVAYLYGLHTARKIGFKESSLLDGFIYGAIIGIIGARIWYVIFEWDSFKGDPIKIITEFQGLAIHGAVIFAGVFAYFYCKKRNEDFFKLGDMLFPGFLIGQIFGRWGNFFNQEAHGGPIADTVAAGREFLDKLPIPKFVVDQMYMNGTYMHPTFLYESIWNLIGLAIILITRRYTKLYWYGDAFLFYLVWYGTGRFFIESMRTDSLYFNLFGMQIRTAQAVSVIMIVVGLVLFTLRRVYKVRPISFMEMVEINKAQ